MTPVTANEVRRTAELSALRIAEDEIPGVADDLSSILDTMAMLEEVMPLPGGQSGTRRPVPVEREDVAAPFPDPESLLAMAPRRRGQFVAVPRIITGEERES